MIYNYKFLFFRISWPLIFQNVLPKFMLNHFSSKLRVCNNLLNQIYNFDISNLTISAFIKQRAEGLNEFGALLFENDTLKYR